jgi:hypothetical protein
MAMDPKNHVAVSASSTTAPVSTSHRSSVAAPSAASKGLDTAARTPAGPTGTHKIRTVITRPAVFQLTKKKTGLQLHAQGTIFCCRRRLRLVLVLLVRLRQYHAHA